MYLNAWYDSQRRPKFCEEMSPALNIVLITVATVMGTCRDRYKTFSFFILKLDVYQEANFNNVFMN